MIDDLYIESTRKTPEIDFSYKSGILCISGISVPENTLGFYDKITLWISEYIKDPKEKTKLIFRVEYYNTSSSLIFLNIFNMFSDVNSIVEIDWYYEEDDTDMLEVGEDLSKIVKHKFNLISVESF